MKNEKEKLEFSFPKYKLSTKESKITSEINHNSMNDLNIPHRMTSKLKVNQIKTYKDSNELFPHDNFIELSKSNVSIEKSSSIQDKLI